MRRLNVAGFSLLELLMVVTVAGVVLGFAAPSFRATISNAKLNATADRLIASLRFAQSAAVRVGDSAFVCASTDGASCSGGSDWSTGWIVMEDDGGVTRLLKVEEPTTGDVELISSDFADVGRITFTSLGAIEDGTGPGTFTACDNRGDKFAKAVIVSSAGLVRRGVDTNGSDIVEDSQGSDISC